MNYLAHIYLSDNNDESMLGNFLGDFVNKSFKREFRAIYNEPTFQWIRSHFILFMIVSFSAITSKSLRFASS